MSLSNPNQTNNDQQPQTLSVPGQSSERPGHQPVLGLYDSWARLIANVGVPTAILLITLLQLVPSITYGIRVAERVDAELNILAINCVALRQPTVIVPVQPNHTP